MPATLEGIPPPVSRPSVDARTPEFVVMPADAGPGTPAAVRV
jgi:hypothetical protein